MILVPAILPAQDFLAADFSLPIYRNRSSAELIVDSPGSDTARVVLSDREGTQLKSFSFPLQAGRNTCRLDSLQNLQAGRYYADITLRDTALRRMLRIERGYGPRHPDGPVADTKLFFTPDGYMIESLKGKLEYGRPQVDLVHVCSTPSEDGFLVFATDLYRDSTGCTYCVAADYEFDTWNAYKTERPVVMKAGSADGPYVRCVPGDTGFVKDADETLNYGGSIGDPKDRYEMYDPARHGTYSLDDIFFIQNIEPHDYGCVMAGYRTYWVVARTSSGEEVFLRDTPVFADIAEYKGDEFDTGFTTNDNFGNFWKVRDRLFVSRGQTVRRDRPFDVPFDNLPFSQRIMSVYSTADGVEWICHNAIVAADESEGTSMQSYEANIMKVDGAELWLAFLDAYDCVQQRVFPQLAYSRDGIHFNKTGTSFFSADSLDHWAFGQIYCSTRFVEEGNYCYQAVSTASIPHFAILPPLKVGDRRKVTAADVQDYFRYNNLESFVYFNEYGGFEGIAESIRKGTYSAGLLKYRADGWFAARAARNVCFVTVPLAARGFLCANATVERGGRMEIALLSEDGAVLQKVRVEGDGRAIPVMNLPESGSYRLRVKMKKAVLYSLSVQ